MRWRRWVLSVRGGLAYMCVSGWWRRRLQIEHRPFHRSTSPHPRVQARSSTTRQPTNFHHNILTFRHNFPIHSNLQVESPRWCRDGVGKCCSLALSPTIQVVSPHIIIAVMIEEIMSWWLMGWGRCCSWYLKLVVRTAAERLRADDRDDVTMRQRDALLSRWKRDRSFGICEWLDLRCSWMEICSIWLRQVPRIACCRKVSPRCKIPTIWMIRDTFSVWSLYPRCFSWYWRVCG